MKQEKLSQQEKDRNSKNEDLNKEDLNKLDLKNEKVLQGETELADLIIQKDDGELKIINDQQNSDNGIQVVE